MIFRRVALNAQPSDFFGWGVAQVAMVDDEWVLGAMYKKRGHVDIYNQTCPIN